MSPGVPLGGPIFVAAAAVILKRGGEYCWRGAGGASLPHACHILRRRLLLGPHHGFRLTIKLVFPILEFLLEFRVGGTTLFDPLIFLIGCFRVGFSPCTKDLFLLFPPFICEVLVCLTARLELGILYGMILFLSTFN